MLKMCLRIVKNSVISAFLFDMFQQAESSVSLFWRLKIWRKWTHVVCQIRMLKLTWWWTGSDWRRKRLQSRRILFRRITTNHSGELSLQLKFQLTNSFFQFWSSVRTDTKGSSCYNGTRLRSSWFKWSNRQSCCWLWR